MGTAQREISGLLTFVFVDNDFVGFLFAFAKFLRSPCTRKWPKFRFNFERRLVHLLLCVVAACVIQAVLHFRENTCRNRSRCYNGCVDDLRPPKSAADTMTTTKKRLMPCNSDKRLQFGPDHLDLEWFVYPKLPQVTSFQWTKCKALSERVFLNNLNDCQGVSNTVCVPSCRDVSEPLIFYPDPRPLCDGGMYAPGESASLIKTATNRSFAKTLLCIRPQRLCVSSRTSRSFRIGITSIGYQASSIFFRIFLLCSCVKKSKRESARRLGYIVIFSASGLAVFVMGFMLVDVGYWLAEACLSLLAAYLLQLAMSGVFKWYLLGSIPRSSCDKKSQIFGVRRLAMSCEGSVFYSVLLLHSSDGRLPRSFLDDPGLPVDDDFEDDDDDDDEWDDYEDEIE